MPKVEVEISEDGKVGTLPEPIQKLFDAKYSEAMGKGAEKAAKEAQGQIEALKAKGGLDPVEREKLKTLEADLSKAQEDIAKRDKNFEEAERLRAERHAKELADRDGKLTTSTSEIDKRTARIRELAVKDISVAALKAGAADDAVGYIEALLKDRIGLDDGLQSFVKDEKEPGKPLLDKDQKPVTIEGFVAQWLADNPRFKAAPSGRGGNARGGQSLAGQRTNPADAKWQGAIERLAENPSVNNAAAAFATITERTSS